MNPRIIVIFFLLIALVLACSLFGCEKKTDCHCETIQDAIRLIEHCDSVTVESPDVSNIICNKELTLSEPIIIYPERGDSVYNCKIWLADDFQGEASFLVVWPKGWDSLVLPISHCTFYPSKTDHLQQKNWYMIVHEVSYKVEYKRHVAMIDSICAGKENCSGSLGFGEYFNQQDPSEPHIVKDLFHKDILITIP